jgi:hypothetical protein
MGVRWPGIALVIALSLTACGDPPTDRSVTEKSAARAAYDGDLAGERAAELALECVGSTFRRGVGDPQGGLEENGETPAVGLDHWLDPEAWTHQVPVTGYAIEREDADRALISYDDRDRTVIAFVMNDGQKDYYDNDEGWVVESYAMCDPSEWPADVAEGEGWGVWTDETGRPVPTDRILSFQGAEHCDWQDSTWVLLGKEGADGTFIGNPDRDLRDSLRTTYALDVQVPADARDTGYQRGGSRLLVAADGSAAYLVPTYAGADRSVGDRWPATKRRIGCI